MNNYRSWLTCLLLCLLPTVASAQVQITSFSPPEVSYLGQTEFTILGNNLSTGPGSATVRLGIFAVPTITFESPTEIRGIAPEMSPIGTPQNCLVIVQGIGSDLFPAATVPIGPLSISSVDPTTVPAGSGVFTIHGVGFTESAQVRIGTNPIGPGNVEFISARELLVTVPPTLPQGLYNIRVDEWFGSGGPVGYTLPNALTIGPGGPTPTAFSPQEASYVGGEPFTINGVNFTPTTVATIDGVPLATTYVNHVTLQGFVPTGTIGESPTIAVSDGGPALNLPSAFTYVGPFEITHIVSGTMPPNTPSWFEMLGSGFNSNTEIVINGVSHTATFWLNHTQMGFVHPGLPPGLYDVTILDHFDDGTPIEFTMPVSLLVPDPQPPTVELVFPSEICSTGGTSMRVVGDNFLPETEVRVGTELATDIIVSRDGTTITCTAPALPGGVPAGPTWVTVSDYRGSNFTPFGDQEYTDDCPTLRAPEQFETSIAEGTARFQWFNPRSYDSIDVCDTDGNVVAVLPGDATFYETPAAPGQLVRAFIGRSSGDRSHSFVAFATTPDCEYPPPLGGAVTAGEIDLPVFGGHAELFPIRCSDTGGILDPPIEGQIKYGKVPSSIGNTVPAWVNDIINPTGGPRPTTLITGFTLDQDADRLEFKAMYRKMAGDFGVSLRGKLVQVFPPNGYVDEFTFPEPIIGDEMKMHGITYFRADRDVSDPDAEPCPSATGPFRPIPAGEYRLEIYAVGGNPEIQYYVFRDDPRDREILIEGVPCPPYPRVEVRDVTGIRTLPNLSVALDNVTQVPGGVEIDLGARGTYFDENGTQWSVDPHCDSWAVAPGGGPLPNLVCLDPPYKFSPFFSYEWSIRSTEPPTTKADGPTTTFEVPGYSCYIVDVTVTDIECGTSRTASKEVVVYPTSTNVCPPNSDYFTFLDPSPDPSSVFAIGNLANLDPLNGVFSGTRPLDIQTLVVPACWCSGITCAAVTPQDVEFRLARPVITGGGPIAVIVYHDLNATIEVIDECTNVTVGPKFLRLRIDDLGEIPWSQYLDSHQFRNVVIQGRTLSYSSGVGGGPLPSPWKNVATFKMTNHPPSLDQPFWEGYYNEESASYHFMTRGTPGQTATMEIEPTEPIDFGLAGAGMDSYTDQESRSGFVSRFMTQGGVWSGEPGDGNSSGNLMGNDMQHAPHVIQPTEIPGTNFFNLPEYEYCEEIDIFSYTFSEDLFDAILYAGLVGPIPVNIRGRVGLGLDIDIDSVIRSRIAPFDLLQGGDAFELDMALFTDIEVEIPCEVAADILGGIASLALRLRPEVDIKIHPYLDIDIPSGINDLGPKLFIDNRLSIFLDAEACVQTLIFGEQCLPTITITLVDNVEMIDMDSDPFPPTNSCANANYQYAAQGGGTVIETHSYELANKPFSVVSPDGLIVIDGWMSADQAGRFLKLTVTENGVETSIETGLAGAAWYFLDPDAAFVSNDVAILVGTSPPLSHVPQNTPTDINDPNYLSSRNANVAHTEVQMAVLQKDMFGQWELNLGNTTAISDVSGTPSANRFADGRPSVTGDPATGDALVAWVRYDDDYLMIDGMADFYEQTPGCPANELCLVTRPNVRPQMEATTITVRKVDANGMIPGEGLTTISTAGINVQPSIAYSPSGNTAYCVWIHDPTHTDLVADNRGRFLKYAVYDAMLGTWSAPSDAVAMPDNYPAMMEPHIALSGDHDGMLSFTAVADDAPANDTGLGGGSRFVYAARLTAGMFATPVQIRGKCFAREYGYGQSTVVQGEILVDQFGHRFNPLDWVMTWQEFGNVGAAEGSGNIQVSGLIPGTNEWTAPISLLNEGTVVSNVQASIFNGGIHAVHHSLGASNLGLSNVGPVPVGYQITEHAMQPDAAVVDCKVSMPMAAPGDVVDAKVTVTNEGLASTPFDASDNSMVGLELVYVRDNGTEDVVASQMLPVIEVGQELTIDFSIEMPHEPVKLIARMSPNPVDRNSTNNELECFFGAPRPTDLTCELVERTDSQGITTFVPRLRWNNPVIYDQIWVYRNGSMVHKLPGTAKMFADACAGPGVHDWCVRGIHAPSKSIKARVTCEVPEPAEPASFIRGDANTDGGMDVADAVKILGFLFNGQSVDCEVACDANDDEAANIADPVFVLAALFSGGALPNAPYPDCGLDPTVGTLDCAQFVPCD